MGQEFPEAELIRKSFTLRQMDLPPHVFETKRSLLRWFALAFGLISVRESRSKILDVLDALFHFHAAGRAPTTIELLSRLNSSGKKVDEKLLRYHIKRLIDVGLLERRRGRLSFCSDPRAEKSDLVAGFRHGIGSPVQESVERVAFALDKIMEKYEKRVSVKVNNL